MVDDSFDETQVELDVLNRKPVCVLVIGKPGCGKSTLAKRLAAVWKCQLVDGTSTIEQAIRDGTPLGVKAQQSLLGGEELGEAFVAELITEKLGSPEIKHYGYVLDCLPSAGGVWLSLEEQLQLLRTLPLSPDVIVNLKIPEQDLEKRRTGQKVDPISNEVFVKALYDPEKRRKKPGEGGEDGEGGEEEEGEGEEEEEEVGEGGEEGEGGASNVGDKDDEFEDDLAELEGLEHLAVELATRLVRRPQDLPSSVQQQILHYKEAMLTSLEDFIIQHNQQYVIELDANLPPRELFKALLQRLTFLGLPRAPAPARLVPPGEEEEEPEGIDNEQFLQQMSETGVLLPGFRWRRSRWGRYCPVQLARGNMVPGRMEFAVGFLDKMYSMSSAEALVEFTRTPRAYLLPPHPRIPCKVCVLGPATSGKSSLARAIAERYHATVVDMQALLVPISERAREAAVEEARQEAETSAISSISAQLATQQTQHEGSGEEVGPQHPEVVKAVAAAEQRARATPTELTQDMYMEALRSGIQSAEQRRRERDPSGPRFGGWVVDGFPLTRENWAAMIEQELLPDFVLSLEDESAPSDYLLTRFTELHGLPDPASLKLASAPTADDQPGESGSGLPEEVRQWQRSRAEFDRLWGQLSASIKGSAIDPLAVDCSLPPDQLLHSATSLMEGVFSYKPVEYSALEDDADVDDDPVLDHGEGEGEEPEEEGDEAAMKRKPWGDSAHFCPVALKEHGVLWPGNQDTAARYRERLYYLSMEEAKEKFMAQPELYTATDQPLQLPPLRVFLLGARGAGKTTAGRALAARLGVFHVAFRELLQEQLLAKMKRPPLVDPDEWEGPEDKEGPSEGGEGGEEEEEELDEDVRERLSEDEEELRAYLLHGDPLSDETTEKMASQFWNTEPYKSTGFIMEGFPSNVDEVRLLASRGLYPDAAIILEVEVGDVVRRLLPHRLEVWGRKRERRLARRALAKEKRLKEWEEDKARRLTELAEDYQAKMAAKRAEREAEEGEDPDEDDEEEEEGRVEEEEEEYRERVAEVNDEEPPDEEDGEEEEEEEGPADAEERMRTALTDKHEELTEAISNMQDVLVELQIPQHAVSGSRRLPVVLYSLAKALRPYTNQRPGLLTKCTPISSLMAKKLLNHGYKQLGKFKRWCPVKLSADPAAVLPPTPRAQVFPVIYRKHVYFPSSEEALGHFSANPQRYCALSAPGPAVPVRTAVVGPPKAGKTTVAKRFVREYGCLRLSVGEAMRRVMAQFPGSKLAELMQVHLRAGQPVPDELCVHALERALLDVQCNTRGYVLDGWPLTKAHVELLARFRVTPVCVLELVVPDQELLRRGALDRNTAERSQALHDSSAALLVRGTHYRKHIGPVREWYRAEHDNWHEVDGVGSQWLVGQEAQSHALNSAQQIQQYLDRITTGRAASIAGLCVTPREFQARLGEFSHYCPVSLALKAELRDCSRQPSLKYAAEYGGKYYKMASQDELEAFLASPAQFVPPLSPRALPPVDLLPQRRSQAQVKAMFPKRVEIQGFCPVSYIDGKKRYESLCLGNPELAAEYKDKLYCFASEDKLEKFMRQPNHYEVLELPTKLPPLRQPVSVTSLPMLGYLEQSAASAIINALSVVGSTKPKFPFLDGTKSALLFVAYHLKAFNPKANDYVRQKYKKKLSRFKERCSLIGFLSGNMRQGYIEPPGRPIDFNHKMCSFLKLKEARV